MKRKTTASQPKTKAKKAPAKSPVSVYSYTNKVTNKVYVGRTTLTTEERERAHKKNSRVRTSPLYRALKHYGAHNFEMKLLEYTTAKKKDEREQYWIDRLGSAYPNGYNCQIYNKDGMTVLKKAKPVRVLTTKRKIQSFINQKNKGASYQELMKKFNIPNEQALNRMVQRYKKTGSVYRDKK